MNLPGRFCWCLLGTFSFPQPGNNSCDSRAEQEKYNRTVAEHNGISVEDGQGAPRKFTNHSTHQKYRKSIQRVRGMQSFCSRADWMENPANVGA